MQAMLTTPYIATAAEQQAHQAALRDVWRASELAISRCTTRTTGHQALDVELPNQGWPRSVLIELLVQQAGIGEMQLLKPALAASSVKQRIALIQPPYLPHSMACRSWGINDRNLLWLRPKSSADAQWAAEQILKSGSCDGVVLWQSNIRPEALRRLNLAAQTTETWFWFVRPLAAAQDSSPSPLRLALRPALGGISVDIVKRKGPHCEAPIFIPLADMPAGRPLLNTEGEEHIRRTPLSIPANAAIPALV